MTEQDHKDVLDALLWLIALVCLGAGCLVVFAVGVLIKIVTGG